MQCYLRKQDKISKQGNLIPKATRENRQNPKLVEEIINVRTGINEIETKKITEKVNESKSVSFEKIHNIDKPLARLIKKKKKESGLKSIELAGFPGGSEVKNPPTNAGDTGSTPDLERSHMWWSNYVRVPQLLGLCSRAGELQLLSSPTTDSEASTP